MPSCSELISNASDALEKLRHKQAAGESILSPESQLAVRITTNEADGTITIADSGVGMDKQELIDNLGTIARSGSRMFIQRLKEHEGKAGAGAAAPVPGSSDTGANIIGQFGVGFYSAFMVAEHVKVYSQSSVPGSPAYCWVSGGDGAFEVFPAADVSRGSKIVIKLKDSCKEYANPATVKGIITKYSNFVNFPIFLNDKQVNTIGAIWSSTKSDVTEEQYAEFYKYKSGDFEPPLYRLHFSADAPTTIKALLYVGSSHDEKYGMGRMKPGVDLYSRRVLIENSSSVMPDWLRFVHGVVDSEDIPLNISRESMQDSALLRRLKAVLTRRMVRFFDAEARKDPQKYATKFFPEFGQFLKEGCITDTAYSQDIAKLLRFESSGAAAGSLTSLDEYIARMPPGQTAIYYLVAPHRGIAEASPYMEAFRGARKSLAAAAAGGEKKEGDKPAAEGGAGSGSSGAAEASADDVEVLFLYNPIDDFVMNNLREYNGRKLVTAETADLDPDTLKGLKKGDKDKGKDASKAEEAAKSADKASAGGADAVTPLTDAQVTELGAWLTATLPKRLSKVRATNRLKASPAVVTDHESASLRRMMRMVEASAGKDSEALKLESHVLPKQTLEINPAHPVIVRLHAIRDAQPALALMVAEQVVDNALVAAGLVDDSRTMLPRLNALLERVLNVGGGGGYAGAEALAAKRWVPPSEKDAAEALKFGEEVYAEVDKELKKQKK